MPKAWLDKEGIMRVRYEGPISISIMDTEKEYELRMSLSNDKHPVLIKLNGLLEFDDDTKLFFSSKKYSTITSAVAIVIPTLPAYPQVTNYFTQKLRRLDVPFPIEIFNNDTGALIWLKQYK